MKWIESILTAVAMVFITYVIYHANFVVNRSCCGSPKNACIANLKQIDGAIQQWALENKREDKDAPDFNAAVKYLKNGQLPQCPSGGYYAAGRTVADAPTCTLARTLGHSLP